jgi:hypothetical protein
MGTQTFAAPSSVAHFDLRTDAGTQWLREAIRRLTSSGRTAEVRDLSDDVEDRLARAQISNDRLLEVGKRFRPPAEWYSRDEEELF